MELRWSMVVLFFAIAILSQCSVRGHTMHIREDYDNEFLGDEADWAQNDDWTQNDDGGNDGDGEDKDIWGMIVTKPNNYKVKIGETIEMECQVTPNEGPVLQWSKNGDGIFIGIHPQRAIDRYKVDEVTRSLIIEHAMLGDEGEYTCRVLVDFNSSSVTHKLVVLSAPNITLFSATNDGNVSEGTDLKLQCDVTSSPMSKIMWSREKYPKGGNVRLLEKDAEFTANSAIIKNVKSEDSGKYYCYAINSEGNAQSEIYVNVLAKPHAHIHRPVINTGLGDHALLQCTTRGNPLPTITWYKGSSKIIPDDKRFSITYDGPHSNLTVVPADSKDFGVYTCVVENYHNKHNRSAELVQRPVVDEVEVVGRVLSWELHSHLPLQQIELQLINEAGNSTAIEIPLPTSQSTSYELKYQMSQDLAPGKYQAFIKAKNENDWSREQEPIIIEILDQPMFIQRSSVYRSESSSGRVSSACFLSTAFIYLLVRML